MAGEGAAAAEAAAPANWVPTAGWNCVRRAPVGKRRRAVAGRSARRRPAGSGRAEMKSCGLEWWKRKRLPPTIAVAAAVVDVATP